MARVLTGIQATNVPHLGNILGAIAPAIEMANQPDNEAFLFIADLHSLTQVRDPEQLKEATYAVAATWLSLGLDPDRSVFYRQSRVPQVTELTWYLSCYMPYTRLKLAHSFKDKGDRLDDVNTGLFTYPVLMAADIVGYDAHVVPVGKDQTQHLEFTRMLVDRINNQYGSETNEILVKPELKLQKDTMLIPGVDGEKMSKSRGNTIQPLSTTKKELKKQIMSIVTDSTPLEEPKNPENLVTQLYELIGSAEGLSEMKAKLAAGGYGYGHAKGELLDVILAKYETAREKYAHYMANKHLLDVEMEKGEAKARQVIDATLDRVRKALGYR